MIVPEVGGLSPLGDRFFLYRAPEVARVASFGDDVRAGLTAEPKHLPPKYFYDDLGSALFEAICELPEYYLTRAETEILETYGHDIVRAIDEPFEMVEFGSGSSRKTRALIEAALARQPNLTYHPIDISPAALIHSASALVAEYERLNVAAYASDYFEVLSNARLRTSQRVLALFLGSNIGNYAPADAGVFLQAISGAFKPGDALLLGTDLKKDGRTLELAYNDPTGVTSAFDKNILGRINRELGGEFDLDAFEFSARYDARRGSVDSYLVARRSMRVPIARLGISVTFSAAETIHTESSHKFDRADVAALAQRNGFRVDRDWTDARGQFLVSLLVIRP